MLPLNSTQLTVLDDGKKVIRAQTDSLTAQVELLKAQVESLKGPSWVPVGASVGLSLLGSVAASSYVAAQILSKK